MWTEGRRKAISKISGFVWTGGKAAADPGERPKGPEPPSLFFRRNLGRKGPRKKNFFETDPPPLSTLSIYLPLSQSQGLDDQAPPLSEGLHPPLLKYGKTGNKKQATCFATLLQNELNSDVARFTTHKNKPCNLKTCKTRNIAIGHFRVPKTFTFKMMLGAQPFL